MTHSSPITEAKAQAYASKFSNPVELPSLEEIEAMDRQREEDITAIEISDDGRYTKCQNCNAFVAIVGKLQRPKAPNDRMAVLQKRIKWLEECQQRRIINNSNISNYNNNISSNNNYSFISSHRAADSLKQAKEELQRLQAEDQKWDRLRHLPLYSSKITGYKFVCSKCYDDLYLIAQEEQRKKT
jgi:hypothetical protein